MKRRKIFWQIYPSFLLLTLFSVLAVAGYASQSLSRFYLNKIEADLLARARLIEDELESGVALSDGQKIDRLCKRLGKNSSVRITVIDPTGRVIGDSEEDPLVMANHSDRPEVMEARAGRIGRSRRISPTLKQPMIYAALPLLKNGQIIGVVRTAASIKSITDAVREIYLSIALAGLGIALFSALIALAISRRISRPLEELKRAAEMFALGELKPGLILAGSEEIVGLAESMSIMAGQMEEKIRAITSQRNEQEAILSSMIEGVLAVDSREHLISLNQAGAKMLGIDAAWAKGKSIQELVRNPALQALIRKSLTQPGPVEGEINLELEGEKFIQVHGGIISDELNHCVGAVIVLNDITRLKQLENMRREFVANVSHELKTPITAIKGSVETLREAAIRDPGDAERFLSIIQNHSDRLNAIVEDLLLLSRIEQEDEKVGIKLEETRVKDLLESALQALKPSAAEKKIGIEISCPEGLVARINPEMIEQAVINLLDNALKYSDPGKLVKVAAEKRENWMVLSVEDQGWGIEKEHLDRIFERFYRVDKSRSRKLGGTGLGLAIVKHIAQAHQGWVSVESEPGKGSKFQIFIQAA